MQWQKERFRFTMPVHTISGQDLDCLRTELDVTAVSITWEVESEVLADAIARCAEAMAVLDLQGTSFNIERIGPASTGDPSS
jgi:hypothetical protein